MSQKVSIENLTTERQNPQTLHLDELSIHEACRLMNEEDAQVAKAVGEELPSIEKVIEKVIEAFRKGGRLIYIGAGTSGRLGVLDAAECVPTFGVEPTMVVGLIAGGQKAMLTAVEGAEDSLDLAEEELRQIQLTKNDVVIGIAASGRTPYVIGGLRYAKDVCMYACALACARVRVLYRARVCDSNGSL